MQISESKEIYLEAIYSLTRQQNHVLAVDIADYLGYSRPSVSLALKSLRSLGLIEIGLHNCICLTRDGETYATQIHERRHFFARLLVQNGMDTSQANHDALRLMHAVSEEGFGCFKKAFS